mmetsp:Transcript_14238/g.36404  ORF Transcript_14238/g.36404 Transcript_14238/m.36404 type:complete len:203 (+) Transcript_14238:1270-1878(+)
MATRAMYGFCSIAPRAMMPTPGLRGRSSGRSCDPPSGKMPRQWFWWRTSNTFWYMTLWSILGTTLNPLTVISSDGRASFGGKRKGFSRQTSLSLTTDATRPMRGSAALRSSSVGRNGFANWITKPGPAYAPRPSAWMDTSSLRKVRGTLKDLATSCGRRTGMERAMEERNPTMGRWNDFCAMRKLMYLGVLDINRIPSTNWF